MKIAGYVILALAVIHLVYALVPQVGLVYGVVVQIDRDEEAESSGA